MIFFFRRWLLSAASFTFMFFCCPLGAPMYDAMTSVQIQSIRHAIHLFLGAILPKDGAPEDTELIVG